MRAKDVGGGALTPLLAGTKFFAAGDGGAGEGGGEGEDGGEGEQGEGQREGGGRLAGKLLLICFILYFLFCKYSPLQNKHKELRFVDVQRLLKRKRNGCFLLNIQKKKKKSKENNELLLFALSVNLIQTRRIFGKSSGRGDKRERGIGKYVVDDIVILFGGLGVFLESTTRI